MSGKCEKDKYDLLDAYFRGDLTPPEKKELKRLLKADPKFRATVDMMREHQKALGDINWKKTRSAAHSILGQLLNDYRSSEKEKGLKQGITVFDSRYLPEPEGIRPGLVDTRRVKYQVGDDFLELTLYPISPGSFEIIGIFTGQTRGDILRVILTGNKSRMEETGNEFQLFRFTRVPSGSYKMQIVRKKELKAKIDIEI